MIYYRFPRILFIALILLMAPLSAAWSTEYTFDHAHSSIGFSIKHLSVGTTKGLFNEYEGTISYDPENPENIQVNVEIQAASIDTRNEQRDDHLRGEDFFDAAKHPLISFHSIGARKVDDKYWIAGDLTIKGVTKRISIPVSVQGPIQSPFGQEVLGLSAEFEINRQDYGVSWNKKLDQGGYVIGDIVNAEVFIEANPVQEAK